MRFTTYSFRFGEQVLNSKLSLKHEIEEIITLFKPDLTNLSRPQFNDRCEHLLAMDEGKKTKVGTQRQNQQPVQNMCADYVDWSANTVISMLKQK